MYALHTIAIRRAIPKLRYLLVPADSNSNIIVPPTVKQMKAFMRPKMQAAAMALSFLCTLSDGIRFWKQNVQDYLVRYDDN